MTLMIKVQCMCLLPASSRAKSLHERRSTHDKALNEMFRLPPESTHRIATNLGVDSSYLSGGGRLPTAAFGPLATAPLPFPFARPFPFATRGVRSLAPGIVFVGVDERVGDWAKTNRAEARDIWSSAD